MVTELLLDFSIKHVHGRPYHPQSQGMVENFNKYIKKYLALSLLAEGNFDLPEQVQLIVDGYNDRIHSVTKKTPREVFFSKNASVLNEVRLNIENYYKNKELTSKGNLKVDDKIAIAQDLKVHNNFLSRLREN